MTFLRSLFFMGMTLCLGVLPRTGIAAACPNSTNNIGDVSSCTVVGNASTFQLNFTSGFDSTETVAPQGGNNGITVGEQRRLAFIKAAEIFSTQIVSSQTIVVDAQFNALECDATSGVLGSAGASSYFGYESGSPTPLPAGALVDTFYPVALANALSETDVLPQTSDIQASFNTNLGNDDCLANGDWYYGFDDNTGALTGFLTVLLHEVTHGLGFVSLVDPSTGEKATGVNDDGSTAVIDDIFSNFLYIKSEGQSWKQLGTSSTDNAKRQQSAVSGSDLFWNGSNANNMAIGLLNSGFSDNDSSNSFTSGDRIEMYTPSPLEQGSSVSHFDINVSPNELMEPNLALNACDIGLALGVLEDLGWSIMAPSKPSFYLNINCNQLENGDTFNNRFKGDAIKITPVSDANSYTFSLDYEGQNANNLVSTSGTGLFINTQSSGVFAGTYTLTVSNGSDPDIVITINRPLRIVWSSSALLNNENYTLSIEGGAANSVYDLTQNQVNVINFLNQQNQSTTSVTATNDSQAYNPAQLNISTNDVVSPLNVTTTVQSQSNAYVDVSDDIKVYPAIEHTFSISSTRGSAVGNVTAQLLDSTLVSLVGIDAPYKSNGNGQLTLNLPDTDDTFTITFSKDGYESTSIDINASQNTHQVSLTKVRYRPQFGSTGSGSVSSWFITVLSLLVLTQLFRRRQTRVL